MAKTNNRLTQIEFFSIATAVQNEGVENFKGLSVPDFAEAIRKFRENGKPIGSSSAKRIADTAGVELLSVPNAGTRGRQLAEELAKIKDRIDAIEKILKINNPLSSDGK